MSLWFAALLGLVQGLTEFIPVSSTAHLRIFPALFGQKDAGSAYTAVIQLGTLLAVLVYFAKDLTQVAAAMFRAPSTPEGRLPWLLAAGTVPIVIVGLLLRKRIETDFRSLYVVAGALIAIGLAMWAIDRRVDGGRTMDGFTLCDAVLVGLAQTLALIPGVSRSGATICMALLLGFARSDAARFSFLLSIPAVAGAGMFEAPRAFRELAEQGSGWAPIAVGILVAAVTGYATITWLIRWLGNHQLVGFAVYRLGLGVVLIGGLATGLLSQFSAESPPAPTARGHDR
jgi:undecaprenyl-diphosphatase